MNNQGACARVAVGQEKIKVGADHHIFIIFSLRRKSRQMASPAAQPTSRANWSSIFLAWGKLSTPKHQPVWMHTSQIKNPFALFLFIDHPMKALVLNGRNWQKNLMVELQQKRCRVELSQSGTQVSLFFWNFPNLNFLSGVHTSQRDYASKPIQLSAIIVFWA